MLTYTGNLRECTLTETTATTATVKCLKWSASWQQEDAVPSDTGCWSKIVMYDKLCNQYSLSSAAWNALDIFAALSCTTTWQVDLVILYWLKLCSYPFCGVPSAALLTVEDSRLPLPPSVYPVGWHANKCLGCTWFCPIVGCKADAFSLPQTDLLLIFYLCIHGWYDVFGQQTPRKQWISWF